MNTEELLTNLSRQFNMPLNSVDQLFAQLLHPRTFPLVLENIYQPQTLFALCLALKQNIKQKNTKTSLLSSTTKDSQRQRSLSEHRTITKSNPLWLQLQKCSRGRKNKTKFGMVWFDIPEQMIRLVSCEKIQSINYWCIYLNYLYVLIQSLKQCPNAQDLTLDQRQLLQASAKFRDQLISKLIFECLITQDEHSLQSLLAILLREIQQCLPQDELVKGCKMTNILQQMMCYASKQLYFTHWIKIYTAYGKQLTNCVLNLCGRFAKTQQKGIIINIVDIILQLLNIHKSRSLVVFGQQVFLNEDNRQLDYQFQETLPAYLSSKADEIISLAKICVDTLFGYENYIEWQSVGKINHIVATLAEDLAVGVNDPFRIDFKQIKQKKQKTLGQIINLFKVIAVKSTNKLLQLEQGIDTAFYYQYSYVQKIMKTISFNIASSSDSKILMQYLMTHYFPSLLHKVTISFENGSKNPISAVFYFMNGMMLNLQNSQSLVAQVSQIFQLFMMKCVDSEFLDEFDDFAQQKKASKEYFKGMVQLFLQLQKYAVSRSQSTRFSLLYQLMEVVLSSQQNRGQYFIHFVLQLLKENDVQNIISKQKLHQMMVYLLQRLKQSNYQKEYLIILDIVSDRLIDTEAMEFDNTISDLWHYITKNIQISLVQFTNNISYELVDILVTKKDKYFICYAVSVLCRTCNKLAAVQVNRKNREKEKIKQGKLKPNQIAKNQNQSLIKKYLFAVYQFFTNLQRSTLNHLGHFQSRSEFFEIIAFLGVATEEDIYAIFNQSIVKNIQLNSHESSLYFVTDTTGLLRANTQLSFKQIFLELALSSIKLNPQILGFFNVETLGSNDLLFEVFFNFIITVKQCCRLIDFKHASIIIQFFRSIEDTINLLHAIYDTDNFKEISEIWMVYIQTNPTSCLPILPQKLYESQGPISFNLLTFYCKNLLRVSSNQQIQVVFNNVFQRKNLNWCTFQSQKLQDNIISDSQAPEILLYFADYLEISGNHPFFNSQYLINTIIRNMYSTFTMNFSFSFSQKSLDFDEDYECLTGRPQNSVSQFEEFFSSKQQLKQIGKLICACHILAQIESGQEIEYAAFEKDSLEVLKQKLQNQIICKMI